MWSPVVSRAVRDASMAGEELNELLLRRVEETGRLDSYKFSRETGREHQAVVGAVKSLSSLGDVSAPRGMLLS